LTTIYQGVACFLDIDENKVIIDCDYQEGYEGNLRRVLKINLISIYSYFTDFTENEKKIFTIP
jgi:hypothetical protein